MRAALAVALALAACGERSKPLPPVEVVEEPPPDADTSLDPDRPELEEVPEEERIAAIEHAMNQLAPVANSCWAAAAADDFHLSGDVRAVITVDRDAGPGAAVDISANTTDDDVLAECLTEVLAAYDWAPPLVGQTLELPFHFDAPSMQNVIDRRFVPRKTQAGVSIGVLLDETNTGNPALSLLEVEMPTGTKSAEREVQRLEVWFLLGSGATFHPVTGSPIVLDQYDALVVPAGTHLKVEASGGPFRALVAVLPGGREGAARAGALPGQASVVPPRTRTPQPTKVRGPGTKYATPSGSVRIVVEPPLAESKLALSFLTLGGEVPAHVHAKETEALYVLKGAGKMTVGGVALEVTEHSVIQIPKGVEHSFTATSQVSAIQLYSPAGPEQRFKKPPPR